MPVNRHIVTLRDVVSRRAFDLNVVMTQDFCQQFCQDFDLLDVQSMKADFYIYITAKKRGIGVRGHVFAELATQCGQTLEVLKHHVHETVNMRFLPQNILTDTMSFEECHLSDGTLVADTIETEELIDGCVDLSHIIREAVALRLQELWIEQQLADGTEPVCRLVFSDREDAHKTPEGQQEAVVEGQNRPFLELAELRSKIAVKNPSTHRDL